MKMKTGGVTFDTNAGVQLQEYVLRQREAPGREATIGFARLYREKKTGAYWLHERFYRNGGGDEDNAIPLSEVEARAWLKDKFGWWKQFYRLEMRVFGSVRDVPA